MTIAFSLGAAACAGNSSDTTRVDCGRGATCDASVDADAPDVDAGTDAGELPTDAGEDAGATTAAGADSGPTSDAGRDAGAPDAGPPPDPCAGITCSNHGWCEAGICLCDVGYAGSACDTCDGTWRTAPGTVPAFCTPPAALDGTEADDPLLDGTAGNDYVRGLGGNDMIRGLDGSDYVNGNLGLDTVNGNAGRDEVAGGGDDDTVYGGADDDVVIGGLGNDTVAGGLGNDRLTGGEGNDTLGGDDGDDRFMIDGLGNDRIEDTSGTDAARCVPGIRVVSDTRVGADRLLILSNGSRVIIVGDAVERILGCS